MTPIGSNSVASQVYSGVQRGGTGDTTRVANRTPTRSTDDGEFTLPKNATPRGEWVLSQDANPQSFDGSAPRGTYLNLVV
jgi:hypothetical protein